MVEDLRDPEPGPGEVLVRVAACGVCHTDLHIHDGSVAFPLPCVLGHEISGTVVGAGDDVTVIGVGDRIVGAFVMPCGTCRMCTAGREELCEPFFAHNRLNGTLYDGRTRLFAADDTPVWMYSMGGLAELAVVPALAVAPVPTTVPLEDAAILGCAFLTAYGALHHVGCVAPGASVVVIGAGGVGLSVVQVARALGAATVIAVDVAADRLATALDLGATATVLGSAADAIDQIRDLTGGTGADVAIEAVGQPGTFRQATEAVADGGRCVMVGIAGAGVTAQVEITRLVRRKLQVLGSFGGRPRSDLSALAELVAAGALDPGAVISRRFALDEADLAYRTLRERGIVGRSIVLPSPRR